MGRGSSKAGGGSNGVNVNDESALKKAYQNINPNYNPNSTKSHDPYEWNCNKCIVAFEANMRGADVEALPYKFGTDSDFSNNPEKAFGYKKSDGWAVGVDKNKKRTVMNIENEMEDYGVGSRAIITYKYAGEKAGHTLNIVQTNKGTRAIDAQMGTNTTVGQAIKNANLGTVTLYRTDNRKIDKSIAERAYKRRKNG